MPAAQSCSSGPEVLVLVERDLAGQALDLVRVAVEDDLDDLVAVDAHREGLLHLRIEELSVLVLVRVRVPRDVRRLRARDLLDDDVRVLLEDVDRVERHLVDPVDLARLHVRDHRVRVRVVGERDRLDVRLVGPVVRVRDEDGRPLLLVLLQGERAARDHRREVVLGRVGLQPLPVADGELAPDVLGDDEELLELGQHVPDRRLVVEDDGRRVGRLSALQVCERGSHDSRRAARVLGRRVRRPGDVLGGEGLPVRPLRPGLEMERPVLPVGRGVPGVGEVADDDVLPVLEVVLDELGVEHDEGVEGLGLDVMERVERVDVVDRPDSQDAALRRRRRSRSRPSRWRFRQSLHKRPAPDAAITAATIAIVLLMPSSLSPSALRGTSRARSARARRS